MGIAGWKTLGKGSYSPHVCKELLEPLLPMHRPEFEPGRSVARVAQAVMEGPVLVEHQAEARTAVKEVEAAWRPGTPPTSDSPADSLLYSPRHNQLPHG